MLRSVLGFRSDLSSLAGISGRRRHGGALRAELSAFAMAQKKHANASARRGTPGPSAGLKRGDGEGFLRFQSWSDVAGWQFRAEPARSEVVGGNVARVRFQCGAARLPRRTPRPVGTPYVLGEPACKSPGRRPGKDPFQNS